MPQGTTAQENELELMYMQYHLHSTTGSNNLILFSFHIESESFLEEVTEYFRNTVSREELQLLLTEGKAWEKFVTEADLSR